MKKLISILTVLLFVAALSAPVYSSDNVKPIVSQVFDEDPKKPEAKKADSKTEKKSSDCATKAEAKSEKKSKSCGDKDKK